MSREIDVADLSVDSVGEFDVVLYLGVFYHRYDAIEALARVARLAKHVLIVETHLDLRDIDVPAMAFYPGRELDNDPTNWWGPNEHCMRALLAGHGFNDIEVAAHPAADNRAIFHAWRSKEARIKPLAIDALPDPPPEAKRSDYDGQHRLLSSIYAALKSNWWRFARK